MDDIDRRSFLKKSAAGAVGIGVIGSGALPAVAKSRKPQAAAAPVSEESENDHADRVVAYVRSGSRSEVTVLVGDREIVTRDAGLARALRRAAK